MIEQLFRFQTKFRTRSNERDAGADNEAIMSIAAAIEAALNKAENEQTGLKARLDDVLSRAAIVGGNEIDEYLTRTKDDSILLSSFDAEIRRGEERLKVLDENIMHFKFLENALQTCFPDLKLKA